MHLNVCKKEAKRCLKARKLRTLRISLSIAALAILFGFASYALPQTLYFGVYDRYWVFILQVVMWLLSFALLGSLRQGRSAWLYCSACGKEPSGVQFLYWLRKGRGFHAAMLHLQIRIRKAAWTILLSLPAAVILTCGILYSDRMSRTTRLTAWTGGTLCLLIGLLFAGIINQKYALAPILFARSAHKGIRSAVRSSCFLMEDDCVRLFMLKLSFLPWAIACLAVLPLVYVVPYYQQTKTCMLRGILRAHTI